MVFLQLKSRDFYTGLKKLPNIIFAHYNISGPKIVAEAESIITISGTTALEAAELGKMAIVFGSSIEYMHLSNILIAHSLRDLPGILRESIQKLDTERVKEIIWETKILKQSYIDLGFYAPETPAFQGKSVLIEKDQIEKAVNLLVDLCNLQKTNHKNHKG